MTVKLPTIDYKAAKDLLAADKNNVTYDDLSSLDNQTVSTAAVNLLKARQATDPSDSQQLQNEIDAINNGTMPAAQVQQILRSASNGELTDALFKTTYGISEAQFQQGQANGTLGSQYGLTPGEIAGMSSVMGSSSSELVKGLAKSGKTTDSMESKSGGPKATIAIGVGPLTSEMSLGEFIGAIIAAVDSVLLSHAKTNMIDAAAAEMRINDVIHQAKDRITTMKAQAALQISQLNDAIDKIKAAKVLQTVMLVVAYIITVILVIASAIATACTFGAAAPTIAGSVLVGAAIIAATTVFFALQLKDIQSADGLNWMQRAANRKYGSDPNSMSAENAAKWRKQKQQYETLLGSIQTIIDVVTAVASLGTSSVGTAVRVAVEKSVQTIMKAIMDVIISMLKKLLAELQKVMKVIGLVLMVGSGTINAMLTSGQLEDLMAHDSSIMKNYRSKFTSQAVEARYKEMRANPQYASLSDDQLMNYASTEQSLINSGDKTALAELYARRENFEQGKSSTIDLSNLHNGAALGALNTYKQSQLISRASGDIRQRTLDSVNGYQSAMDEYNQKNQGLIMAITIGAAIAGMAGGIGLASGGKSLQGAENEMMQSAAQSAKNLARRSSQELGDAGEEAAEAIKRAARRVTRDIADAGEETAQATTNAARKAAKEMAERAGSQGVGTASETARRASKEVGSEGSSAAEFGQRLTLTAEDAAGHASMSSSGAAQRASKEMGSEESSAAEFDQRLTLTAEDAAGHASMSSSGAVQRAESRALGSDVADASDSAADAARKAAMRAKRYQDILQWVQASSNIVQGAASSASEIYQQELNIKTIQNELEINEKRRQFELIFALQDLATEVLNQLKDDIMDIETRSLSSAKQFNAAIASIWKGLEASFKAAEAKKN